MNRIKYAFSMVEMMILLLIASLIVAASVPLITKKHLHMPTAGEHGSYACYYQDGHLMELRTSGKSDSKMLAGYPREVANCVFEPPQKASLFQISVIGGGGGGGDAGFTGTLPTTVNNEGNSISPFGESENGSFKGLTKQNLYDIGVDSTDDAINEVVSYMGKLWGFAEGANTGKHGDLYYTSITTGTQTNDCPVNCRVYDTEEQYKNIQKSIVSCKGATEENDVEATIKLCYKLKIDEVDKNNYPDECSDGYGKCWSYKRVGGSVGGYYDYNYTWQDYHCKTYMDVVETKIEEYPCTKTHRVGYTDAEYYDSYVSGQNCEETTNCGDNNNASGRGQQNAMSGGGCPTTYKCTDIYSPCSPGIPDCLKTPPQPIYEDYETTCTKETESKVYDDNGNVKQYLQRWTDKKQEGGQWGVCTNTNIVDCRNLKKSKMDWKYINNNDESLYECVTVKSTEDTDTISVPYNVPVYNGKCGVYNSSDRPLCDLSSLDELKTNTYTYTINKDNNQHSIGKSKFCTTSSINGALGLTYVGTKTYGYKNAPDGIDINKNTSIKEPNSFCGDENAVGDCGPSEGGVYTGYASAKIGNKIIKSNSATPAPKSNSLKQTSMTLSNVLKEITDSDISTQNVTLYYDQVLNDGKNGTDGTCEPTSGGLPDCRGGNDDIRFGYCLQHYGKNASDAEYFGMYYYNDTHDINSLSKGFPGESGEYKTTVVRSLSGQDLTINVGRGGSAAAISLGQAGADGSATTFGNILRAEGGKGGQGSQPEIINQELPKYDSNTMNFRKLKSCLTESAYDNDEQCIAWRNNPGDITFYKNTSSDLGSIPTKTTVGGMFSFVLSALANSGDNAIQAIIDFAGRGGNGGGVQHFCWAGQKILTFEGQQLLKSSVYRADDAPSGVPDNHKIPSDCQTSYQNIPAGNGYDGAVIITW